MTGSGAWLQRVEDGVSHSYLDRALEECGAGLFHKIGRDRSATEAGDLKLSLRTTLAGSWLARR